MNKYHKWLLIASGVAAALLAGAVALMIFSAMQTDAQGKLAAAQSQVEDLRVQLKHSGDTIQLLDDQLHATKAAGAPAGMQYLGSFMCTAYCCEHYAHICGTGDGITATGTEATPGRTVAADWDVLPPGSIVYIVGVGIRTVEDRGSAVQGKQLDVAVALHSEALTWAGYGPHDVYLIEAAQ
ncbi:MAG: 3D domain-containing protein [Pygmaiobacter sp.]|nr:3D domain-containing protein [Pygmaiobacter sp.]